MKDSYSNWRTSEDGSLTATETTDAMEIGAAPTHGFGVAIHVPAQDASGDSLTITFTESATQGGTYREFAAAHPVVTGSGDAAAPIDLNLRIYNTQPWVKCVLTVVDAGSADFGAVHVGLEPSAHRNDLQIGDNN
ncbi:MAG: hypothetical protein NUW01_05980 [Gemmatimonadaceae bacterium]|nr:hypothetical protein [Gemmatimonadaceae bacterium]